MLRSIEEVYCVIDEIVQAAISKKLKIGRRSKLTVSEALTIMIEGHKRNLFTVKQLYELVCGELRTYFKCLPSYVQFTRKLRSVHSYLDLVIAVISRINSEKKQELAIVDSTSVPVAGYNRKHVKWAADSAGKSKNMHGFYQGFKLHLIINQNREVISAMVTKANLHDIQALKNTDFIKHVKGILIGDKGYVASEKHLALLQRNGIKLIAKQRRNMDPYLNQYYRPLLKQRGRIESIFGQLKTRLSLIFPFARTADGFLVQVKAALLTVMLGKFNTRYV